MDRGAGSSPALEVVGYVSDLDPGGPQGRTSAPRVLHVTQPAGGGVGAYVEALAGHQADAGWDVHVAGPVPVGGPAVRHHEWKALRSPLAGVRHEYAQLRRVVDAVRPDVVVTHSAKAGLVGRAVVRGRIPTVYMPHAWSFLSLTGATARAAIEWERLASRWTNVVIAVSAGEAELGVRVGVHAPLAVVPNSVAPAWSTAPRISPRHGRALVGLPQRPTVVAVGRLTRQKGQDLLLAAWRVVLQDVPDAQLVLVGDGPDRRDLQAHADRSVIFAGAHSHVRPWMQAADVVALPSRWEGMALSMLEALATSRPVVASHVAGSDVVVRARAGAVVGTTDSDGWARALALRLNRPEVSRSEGDRGAAYVRRCHEASRSLEAVSQVCARARAFGYPSRRLAGRAGARR